MEGVYIDPTPISLDLDNLHHRFDPTMYRERADIFTKPVFENRKFESE